MLANTDKYQLLLTASTDLQRYVDAFLLAKKAEGLASGTLSKFYAPDLRRFVAYCQRRGSAALAAVDASIIREWLLDLAESHNSGGVHHYFRALRTFLRWAEVEELLDRNPIKKVKPPRLDNPLLDPVGMGHFGKLLGACGSDVAGLRDRAIFLTLLDTGARATEVTAFTVGDFQLTGELRIRRGKMGIGRIVFVGSRTRQAIRRYLRERGEVDPTDPLFCERSGGRFTYQGLRSMLLRRSADAGARVTSLHAFRRACALELLRNGADLLSVSRLLGHKNLETTKRYLKQLPEDLRQAHVANSPVDRADW